MCLTIPDMHMMVANPEKVTDCMSVILENLRFLSDFESFLNIFLIIEIALCS